jgi:hypothetical protein
MNTAAAKGVSTNNPRTDPSMARGMVVTAPFRDQAKTEQPPKERTVVPPSTDPNSL